MNYTAQEWEFIKEAIETKLIEQQRASYKVGSYQKVIWSTSDIDDWFQGEKNIPHGNPLTVLFGDFALTHTQSQSNVWLTHYTLEDKYEDVARVADGANTINGGSTFKNVLFNTLSMFENCQASFIGYVITIIDTTA